MKVGYARVSTEVQSLALQEDALKLAGCEHVYSDTASGARNDRIGLKAALAFLRQGDALVVWKLDRLGRGVRSLVEVVTELEARGVNFQSLTDNIDTSTAAGRFFFHVMASLAQMERELLIERTRAGLAAARSRGRVGGRKRLMTETKVEAAKKLITSGVSVKEVAHSLGVSVPTIYRWLPASARK